MQVAKSFWTIAVGCLIPFQGPVGSLTGENDPAASKEVPSIVKRFIDPLTRRERPPIRTVLESDVEHASSIAPVLVRGRPVYIRYQHIEKPRSETTNCILEGGRFFVNHQDPFSVSGMPLLKIRPIDGRTRIPFLIRAVLTPLERPASHFSVYVFVRLPLIFAPEVEVTRAYLGSRRLECRVVSGPDEASYTLVIPITVETFAGFSAETGAEITLEGAIHLKEYRVLHEDDFLGVEGVLESRLRAMGSLVAGRDYVGADEGAFLQSLIQEIQRATSDPFRQLLLAHRLTSTKMSYFSNTMHRTAVQALTEGMGDCDDYSRVLVCLLRALGIPSRVNIGHLYDFNNMGPHAWVEAGLPTRSRRTHWFICDPTLASSSPDKDSFVQFRNRLYLYPLRFDLKILNLQSECRTTVLLNWSDGRKKLPASAIPSVFESLETNLESSLTRCAEAILERKLLFPRQFMFSPGASCLLVERKTAEDGSQFRLLLDSEERLVAELSGGEHEAGLDTSEDQRMVQLLRKAHQDLKQKLFGGVEARYCLELSYARDRFTDRLQRVQLAFSRYLGEQHLEAVVGVLLETGLLLPADAARITALYETCGGRNVYYLQELARRKAREGQLRLPPAHSPDGATGSKDPK